MARFKMTTGTNGTRVAESVQVPGNVAPPSGMAIDEALQTKRPLELEGRPKREAGSPRRRIIRDDTGGVHIEGGPGPGQASGFDDMIEDPEAGSLDMSEVDLEDADTDDADDLAAIDEANEATAAAKAAEEEAAPEKHPCPECDFEAATLAGLSSHRRAKHDAPVAADQPVDDLEE